MLLLPKRTRRNSSRNDDFTFNLIKIALKKSLQGTAQGRAQETDVIFFCENHFLSFLLPSSSYYIFALAANTRPPLGNRAVTCCYTEVLRSSSLSLYSAAGPGRGIRSHIRTLTFFYFNSKKLPIHIYHHLSHRHSLTMFSYPVYWSLYGPLLTSESALVCMVATMNQGHATSVFQT